MAKGFIQGGGPIVPVTAPFAVSAGNIVVIRSLYGVAQANAAIGERVDIECPGGAVYLVSATTHTFLSVGERVFWNATSRWLDKTSAAQPCLGVAVPLDTLLDLAKATGTGTCRVLMAPINANTD